MFDSMRKTAGSSVEEHVKGRRLVWNVARQLTENRLVHELAQGYFEIESNLAKNNTYSKLEDACREGLHPAIDPSWVDAGNGIVIRDVLHFIKTGEPLLPLDWFAALLFIEKNKLIERVRSEVTRIPSAAELREKRLAEQRQRAFEEDLKQLEQELQQAKRFLSSAAKQERPAREARVKVLEETIAKMKASGEPLKSIHWVK